MSVGSQREGPGASSHRSQLKSELPLLHITHDAPLSALSHIPSIRKGHQKQEAPASPLVVQSLLSSSETAASPGPSRSTHDLEHDCQGGVNCAAVLRDMGHVVAVVHSEYEGAVGVRVGVRGRGGAVSGLLSQQRRKKKSRNRGKQWQHDDHMAGLLEMGFLDLRDAQHALRDTEGMRSGF